MDRFPELPDRELMLAVRSGDLEALDALFGRHHRRLFGFLARLTGDPHAAEDLVQEVFLRLLRFRGRYAGEGEFTTWLYRIARNVAADHHARRRDTVTLDAAPEFASDGEAPLDRLAQEERQQRLAAILQALPAAHREVLLLRGTEGLPHRELARALGCTEGAARVRLHRALAALKRQWQALAGELR